MIFPEPSVWVGMTDTDNKFALDKPNYYIFEKEIQLTREGKERHCLHCGEVFQTRMTLNHFCSPEHKRAYLGHALKRQS
jgi:hypothetical protein